MDEGSGSQGERLVRLEERLSSLLVRGDHLEDKLTEANDTMIRVEAKLDSISGILIKVILAQLGMIAATIGVEFIPRSPVNWNTAVFHTIGYIGIFSIIFLILIMGQIKYQWGGGKDRKLSSNA